MNDKIICEVCGSEMIDRSTEYTTCMECPKCGWGWATTNIAPMAEDETDYEIWLSPGNEASTANVKLIAEIAGINYLESRKLICHETPVLLYKAHNESISSLYKAQRVQIIAAKLKAAKMVFFIIPEFPYGF